MCYSFESELLLSLCFGSAFLTRILLPSISFPLRLLIAAFASPCLGISTKPNPLDVPVCLSSTRLQDCTAPWVSNKALSDTSVVVRAKLRMSSFIGLSRLAGLLGFKGCLGVGTIQCLVLKSDG